MIFKGIIIAVALTASSLAFGQAGTKNSGQGQKVKIAGRQVQRVTPEEKVERLGKAVNLTPEQKKKILGIYKASTAKRKAVFEDKATTFDQKRVAFEKIGTDMDNQFKAVLTKEQLKKLENLRKQRAGGH